MIETELIYGFHPVREVLRSRPHQVVEILVGQKRGGARRREIEQLARRHRLDLSVVDASRLSPSGGFAEGETHNGFAVRLRRERSVATHGDPQFVVLLEDINDPRNFGALLRVCECAGVGRVMVRDRGSAPITETVVRTSTGASEWLEIERYTNTVQELDRFKADGFWIYGSDAGGAPPWTVDLTGPTVLCIGGEEKGLRARTRTHCDLMVGLPMLGRVESLNVATAASALLFEAVRQRQTAGAEAPAETPG